MDNWNIANNNGFTYRDVYPTSTGQTIGQMATGATSSARPGVVQSPTNDAVSQAAAIGGQGNPVIAGLVFLALVFGLMFLARRLGNTSEFGSLKPSVYNVAIVSLAATAGMPIWKYLATRFPVPGLSTWILAS